MKILELIDRIGNIGNRPDVEQWREEVKAEAEKLIAVVRAVCHYDRCEIPTKIADSLDALDPNLKPWRTDRTEEFQDFIIHTHELLVEPLVELEALGDDR